MRLKTKKTDLNSHPLSALSFQHPDSTGSRVPFVTFALMALGHLMEHWWNPWLRQNKKDRRCFWCVHFFAFDNSWIQHILPESNSSPGHPKRNEFLPTIDFQGQFVRFREGKTSVINHFNSSKLGISQIAQNLPISPWNDPCIANCRTDSCRKCDKDKSTHRRKHLFFPCGGKIMTCLHLWKIQHKSDPTNHGEEQQESWCSKSCSLFSFTNSVLWLPLRNWRWLQKRRLKQLLENSQCLEVLNGFETCYEDLFKFIHHLLWTQNWLALQLGIEGPSTFTLVYWGFIPSFPTKGQLEKGFQTNWNLTSSRPGAGAGAEGIAPCHLPRLNGPCNETLHKENIWKFIA